MSVKHREEIIRNQIRISQLHSQEDKLTVDLDTLSKENEFYLKKNSELELENDKFNKEIHETLQKIDINNLLKEVDIEDLRLIAQNNKLMSNALYNLLGKWDNIANLKP